MPNVFKAAAQALKQGGILLFRDYAINDYAEERFEKKPKGEKKLDQNFYVRGDGTQVYYFNTEFLINLAKEIGFEVISADYVHREVTNKKEEINWNRAFLQAKFKKL